MNGDLDGLLLHNINIQSIFTRAPDKNRARKALKISRSHLTTCSTHNIFQLFELYTIKGAPRNKSNVKIVWGRERDFLAFYNSMPRLRTYREEIFNDKLPNERKWSIDKILKFSRYPVVNNYLSYQQEYNEQPIYEIDCQYSPDEGSENNL